MSLILINEKKGLIVFGQILEHFDHCDSTYMQTGPRFCSQSHLVTLPFSSLFYKPAGFSGSTQLDQIAKPHHKLDRKIREID